MRYGAKVTDWGIILLVIYLIPWTRGMLSTNLGIAASALLLLPWEVLTMRFLGNTPGKALYNIRIDWGKKGMEGERFWIRSLWSVVAGLGLGIWWAQIGTLSWQYMELKRYGQAFYDRKLGIKVTHTDLSAGQKLIIVLTHVLAIWILLRVGMRMMKEIEGLVSQGR